MRRILVYGSLRKDEYNYQSFKKLFGDEYNYIRTIKIKGFDLFSFGAYPGIKESENLDQELTVDIMECSEDCHKAITRMELGAGYKIVTVKDDEDIDCDIYVYEYSVNNCKKVNSGDWSDYLSIGDHKSASCLY